MPSPRVNNLVLMLYVTQVSIPYGHFYAYTLLEHLDPQLDPDDGVVRISLVHYNTGEDVNTIIGILEEVLA